MKSQILTMALAMAAMSAAAQGTLEDYARAYSMNQKFSRDSVYHWARNTEWRDSSYVLSYNIQTPEGRRYITYNATSGEKNTYNSHEEYANAVGLRPQQPQPPHRGPINRRRNMQDWAFDEEKEVIPVVSPDGKQEAYIEGCNVVLHEVGKPRSEKRTLTQDGTPGKYYSNQIQWSPDGKYLFVCKRTPVETRRVHYVESSPADQLQPVHYEMEYAKPGDALPQYQPTIINVASGKKVEADAHDIESQFSMWYMQWTPDSKEVTMEYNQRGHKLYQLLAMDAETGKLRTVAEEKATTFVNYYRIYRQFINDGKQLLWTSERDNWNHLYLYDVKTGKLIRQVTKGAWCVRGVQHVDEKNGIIYFSASGMNAGEDPYFVHYYKIGLDGKGLTALTPEEGNHDAKFSYDYKYLVDTYSKVDQAPVTTLRSTSDGSLTATLETADISRLKANGWTAPEVFTAKGRDGKTDMWGIIQRPTNFDPSRKYPVIEYIYSGPGSAYTPKSFAPYSWTMTSLAELGFIVVQLDAMGTSWRGKKFEEICYKNLKDSGFPDRELWIKAAGAKYPYMDVDRVGIYGASAGGQESTTAVLLHGDFYKAAYSSCGCHDNRMDKIWWNEQWMGYPIDSSYVECSNVANAYRLERPLMLVVGEMDTNVDPSSTYQVVDALIKADKDFELVVLPGAGHTLGESFGEHKRYDFFVRNLLGVTPPKWSDVKKMIKK